MSTKTPLRLALALCAPLAFLSADARAEYRYLCTSVVSACEYTGPDAPVLRANVCWDGTRATLASEVCPTGSWPYYVEHGEVVDPVTNEVAAYVPLDWACRRLPV